ncbi:MAG TPA: PadR family transcriptional regulator [Bacillota bacterium]|nr:PadR family transcriptional regulator [Bacillota bacterium]
METRILRRLFLGFISIHILHHASQEPIYGAWMMEELGRHGYQLSSGTLYPILHQLERDGLLVCEEQNVAGKIRKYYRTTTVGQSVLAEARNKAYELFGEISSPGKGGKQ